MKYLILVSHGQFAEGVKLHWKCLLGMLLSVVLHYVFIMVILQKTLLRKLSPFAKRRV
ncbi:hypothetical protein SDC49_09395 [Lactobacillus sp. R2/2]|nr:hypothetical protein [Lactobacillus sp. R2/2]